jgi:predicted RNA-binding protein with PUA-like domain
VAQRGEGARDQVGALRSVLDLERVGQAVRPIVNNQPVLGIFAAALLVDLSGRRGWHGRSPDRTGRARESCFEPRSRKALCIVLQSSNLTTRNEQRGRGAQGPITTSPRSLMIAMAIEAPNYWVFVCNPKRWAIDRFLAERIERDTWGVRPPDQRRFAPGQLALIRVGVDTRTHVEREGRPRLKPGIYALCEVESMVRPGSGASDRFWGPGKARSPGWPTVAIRYLRVYAEQPLTIAHLKAERPNLSPKLLKGFQAASFSITEADFRAVVAMLGEDLQSLPGPPTLPPDTLADLADLEQRYLHAAPEVKERISKAIERGPIGALVKRLNEHRCQVCLALGRDPCGFKKPDGEPYIEAHHVVPVAQHQVGTLAAGNVITVCANHHRQLHYGGIGVEIGEGVFRFDMPEATVNIPQLQVPSRTARH